MRVLGVFGFLLLAGLFFTVGVFCLGPWLKSAQNQATPENTVSRPVRPDRFSAHQEPDAAKGPDIKLEVTETQDVGDLREGDDSPRGDRSRDEADVRVDDKTITVTLDDKEKQPSDRPEPPAASESKRATPTTRPPSADKPGPPQSSGSSLEKPRAATEKRSTVYQVQAGSYASKSNADDLAAKLKNDGYRRTIVVAGVEKDRTLYRVQVGEYKTREDAEELAKDLKATGYGPAVIEKHK